MLTVRGLQVVKTNMATYRTQKIAVSWIADSVFYQSCRVATFQYLLIV